MKPSYLGGLYLTLAASIWGGMYVVSKYALATVPPFTFLFIRYLLAGALLVTICWYRRIRIFPEQQRGIILQIGFFGYFLSIAAQFVGTKLSSAHMGAVITTLSPVFLSLFAVFMLKEKMSIKQFLSSAIAFSGVVVILAPWQSNLQAESSCYGNLILVMAALFWGYYSVLSRRASAVFSPLRLTTLGVLIAAVLSTPMVLVEANQWAWQDLFTLPILASVLYVAVLSTALAFFCWNKGLALVPAHEAGLFFFFQPIVGTLLSWFFLQEQISWAFFGGGLLIMVGVFFSMQE